MILSFHPCLEADVQIVLGDRDPTKEERRLIGEAHAVILPQGCSQDLYELCAQSRALLFPSYETRFRYPGKTGQSLLFRDLGLAHPNTIRWGQVKDFMSAHPDLRSCPQASPFFMKADKGHEAHGVFLVKDEVSLVQALANLKRLERSGLAGFVTQTMVPCEGNVLRAVVMGNRIFTYWKRPRKKGQLITTLSRDALIDKDWEPDLQSKGAEQARILGYRTGINLAGVDFVFALSEPDPQPVFLEVNYFFGRRGLGGLDNYYRLLFKAVKDWLRERGLNPQSVRLV